jgi:hypothetical protein
MKQRFYIVLELNFMTDELLKRRTKFPISGKTFYPASRDLSPMSAALLRK